MPGIDVESPLLSGQFSGPPGFTRLMRLWASSVAARLPAPPAACGTSAASAVLVEPRAENFRLKSASFALPASSRPVKGKAFAPCCTSASSFWAFCKKPTAASAGRLTAKEAPCPSESAEALPTGTPAASRREEFSPFWVPAAKISISSSEGEDRRITWFTALGKSVMRN